ncbi:hypothetical protein CEUSTIGMA_g2553.t1 [Chlamydomonas eustigma]|uniref:Oxidoreductase FAD/NAD(P)-binding domain-containing protein n=1 Tax=Chlamydomonas eustigma TaxID=1157962 RepID=A0A250WWN0_9CHLO|nr:hypothetical protein CEUSTIGMA_g2553.t1 [Chlamydomonas eustigma]|eukprot:GAX75109.1 hypothetical protein CEUSTIGMA_g2553.t1 [Chlamydomonas eustigma]
MHNTDKSVHIQIDHHQITQESIVFRLIHAMKSMASHSTRFCRSNSALDRRSLVVRANWGAPVEFSDAKVISNKTFFPGMHQIVIGVEKSVTSSFTKPGQYIQAKVEVDNKPGFFAVASAPNASTLPPDSLELLIKSQPGSSAEAIANLAAGGQLLVSTAQGKGFALDKIPVSDVDIVLMFATGSGVSPLKSVIESGLLGASERSLVQLFYGTRNSGSTAYQDLVGQWQATGVKIKQVFSGEGQGYVQDALVRDIKAGILNLGPEAKVGVLLCGQKEMCNAVTDTLVEAGVNKDRILMNF